MNAGTQTDGVFVGAHTDFSVVCMELHETLCQPVLASQSKLLLGVSTRAFFCMDTMNDQQKKGGLFYFARHDIKGHVLFINLRILHSQ